MRRSLLLALLLLALGGVFRLWASEHARFTGDESHAWAKSHQVATGRFAPAFGLDVTGSKAKHPGPTYYYLMAIPQLVSASPRAGATFVVLLHVLTGWLLFCMARAARSERAGLIALALFAFAPWEVLYADRIWGSSVAPIWGAIALYAAYRARQSRGWQGALLFCCLVLPQIHLSAPVLWLACAVLLVLRPPKALSFKALGIATLLAILTYAPAIYSELMTGFENTRAIMNKGGGTETMAYAMWNPVRVLGYMVLYGSGEISYHFARGYWGGGFDDAAAYLSGPGWSRFFDRQGALMGGLGVLSIGLALLAWASSLGGTAKEATQALLTRCRDKLSLDRALTLSLFVAFVAAGLLLLVAKKRFFPHYANILMPIALWPMASAIDRWWDRAVLRVPVLIATVGSLAFMAVNTSTYYREVDTLNGLANTLTMVKAVVDDEVPGKVSFTHFNNSYAWSLVASELYKKPLPHAPASKVRWTVHNTRLFEGDLPKGGQFHGGVLLRRSPPTGGDLLDSASATVRDWRQFEVTTEDAQGHRRACQVQAGSARGCQYGAQPWQKFGPEVMQMGRVDRTLLFLHPIEGSLVQARRPLPAGTRQVILHYGLSDGACAAGNTAPVRVQVLDAEQTIGAFEAGNAPGLHSVTLTRSSTQAGHVSLQLRTDNEGARIFGFDLRFAP